MKTERVALMLSKDEKMLLCTLSEKRGECVSVVLRDLIRSAAKQFRDDVCSKDANPTNRP